jgi:hypothetical protein
MRGRDFLDLARELILGTTEKPWRGAVGRAYYALLLECREALARWGLGIPGHGAIHAFVRLKFTFAGDADLKRIGDALDFLNRWRNRADYDLTSAAGFISPAKPGQTIPNAASALALLDQIEADPVRRAAAIASLPP